MSICGYQGFKKLARSGESMIIKSCTWKQWPSDDEGEVNQTDNFLGIKKHKEALPVYLPYV